MVRILGEVEGEYRAKEIDSLIFCCCVARIVASEVTILIMVVSDVPMEAEVAQKVLEVVTHNRLEGLTKENAALMDENRRLTRLLQENTNATLDLEDQLSDLQVTLSEVIQENGGNGITRPDIRARHRVCAFCFDWTVTGGSNILCNCREYVYCSRDCQQLHWSRHHKYNCVARVERYPRRPFSP